MTEQLVQYPPLPEKLKEYLKENTPYINWGSDSVIFQEFPGYSYDLAGIKDNNKYEVELLTGYWINGNGNELRDQNHNLKAEKHSVYGPFPTVMFSLKKRKWVMLPSEETSKFLVKFFGVRDKYQRFIEYREIMLKQNAQLKELILSCQKDFPSPFKFWIKGRPYYRWIIREEDLALFD